MLNMEHSIDYIEKYNKAREGILLFQNGELIFCNSIIEEVIGLPFQSISQCSFLSFIHPDDQIIFTEKYTGRLLGEPSKGQLHFRIFDCAKVCKWIQMSQVTVEWKGNPALLCLCNDITQLKEIEYNLLHSEKKYRNIVENIREGVYEVDLFGNFIFANNNCSDIFGYKRDELLKLNYADFLDKESASKVFRIFNNVYKNDTVAEIEGWSMINKNSNELFINASVSTLKNEDGNKIGFMGIIRNITEKKKTEDKLKKSEEQYRLVVENISDTIYKIKPDGHLSFVSPSAIKKTGYSKEDLLNTFYLDLVADNYKEEAKNIFEMCIEKGEGYTYYHEFKVKSADNAELWAGQNIRVVKDENDNDLALYIVARDITEIKKVEGELEVSEKKYRELVEEKTHDIIFSLDNSFHFLTVNNNMRKILGYTEKDLKGRHLTDILLKDLKDPDGLTIESILEHLNKVASNGTSNVRFKAVCSHNTVGEPVVINFKLDPIFEEENVTGIIGFMYPETEDPMCDYLVKQNVSYEIDNKLITVSNIINRLTRDLKKFIDDSVTGQISIALMEMLINAIEHGNLNISYKEKTEAKKSGTYFKLLKKRLSAKENQEKKVYIDYTLDNKKVTYKIHDEGTGFNHKEFFREVSGSPDTILLQNGRGLLIAKDIFDVVEFNDTGNSVFLVKYFYNI